MINLTAIRVESLVTRTPANLPYFPLVTKREKTLIQKINKLDHAVSINIKYNKVNNVIENVLKLESSNSLSNNPVKDNLPIGNVSLRSGKNSRHNLKSCLTCLWDIGSTYGMIECKHINTYKSKLRANDVKYRTSDGP